MKISTLKEIQFALKAWGKKPSQLSYIIAKNLKITNEAVTKANETFEEGRKPFVELDEKGDPIPYYGDQFGNPLEVFKQNSTPPAGTTQMVYKVNDKDGFLKFEKDYKDDEIAVEFKVISEEKVEEEVSKGAIEAEILTPLIGTVILEK